MTRRAISVFPKLAGVADWFAAHFALRDGFLVFKHRIYCQCDFLHRAVRIGVYHSLIGLSDAGVPVGCVAEVLRDFFTLPFGFRDYLVSSFHKLMLNKSLQETPGLRLTNIGRPRPGVLEFIVQPLDFVVGFSYPISSDD